MSHDHTRLIELLAFSFISALAACDEPEHSPSSAPPQTDLSTLQSDYQAWQARVTKLRSCDLLDDGALPFDPRFDHHCESLCMIAASCAELKKEACNQQDAASLEACFDKCDEDVATCADGETVSADSVCDLAEDCKDGEDEKHCEPFTCADGSHIAITSRCDAEPDCADESDEKGCALICGRPRAEIQ